MEDIEVAAGEVDGWDGIKPRHTVGSQKLVQHLQLRLATLTTMPREIEPPTIQKEFLIEALSEGKRLDGRIPLEQRPIELSFGAQLGSVECRLGKTV